MGSFRVFAWMASYNFAIERLGTHPELLRSKMPFPLVNVWWKWMKMTCCTWHVGLSMRHDNRAFWRWHCNMIWDCRFGHRQESRNPGSWLWYLIAGFCRSLSFIRGGQCINIAWPCLHLLGEFHADIALAKQNKSTFREGLKQRLHWSKHITLPYIAYPCSCQKWEATRPMSWVKSSTTNSRSKVIVASSCSTVLRKQSY